MFCLHLSLRRHMRHLIWLMLASLTCRPAWKPCTVCMYARLCPGPRPSNLRAFATCHLWLRVSRLLCLCMGASGCTQMSLAMLLLPCTCIHTYIQILHTYIYMHICHFPKPQPSLFPWPFAHSAGPVHVAACEKGQTAAGTPDECNPSPALGKSQASIDW